MNNSIKNQITEALITAMSATGQHNSEHEGFKKIYAQKLTSGPERAWQDLGNGAEKMQINDHIVLLKAHISWIANEETNNQLGEVLRRITNLSSVIRSLVASGWVLEYDVAPPVAEIQIGKELNWLVRGIIRRREPLPSI